MEKKYPSIEKTFVMIKPDGVKRGLVGKIFQRFEEQGLKLCAARMVLPQKKQVAEHYPGNSKEWLEGVGKKTIQNYEGNKKLVQQDFGVDDPLEIGKIIYKNLSKYLCEAPVIISVWEGNKAVERVRKLAGSTVPTFAELGSIRGSFAFDTPDLAIRSGRIVFKNLLHISDCVEEARREIKIWFGKKYKDLSYYERIDYLDIY
ncbi:nucleoside-diphosphate kinase [Candidatus Dojkabacteria bacterium]|nr:nucleoside-diphosphate kinase [Candidatus Dojkabacteria bacterium]